MSRRARVFFAFVPTLAGVVLGGVWQARAQTPQPAAATQQTPPTTVGLLEGLLQALFPTTTTAPPPKPAPTAPPPSSAPDAGSTAATAAGTQPELESRTVPPEAQAIINSVLRTGSNNNVALLEALQPLTDIGLSQEEAAVVGMGAFPVAGEAYWSDDWWMPRFTPEFHLHQGTDIFAARGAPVRAPVDGRLEYSNGGAGGLGAYVTAADGTFFYMAHLDSFNNGLSSGQFVKQGQIVGFNGSSGNADGGSPHVHLQIHPRGGAPINPKPIIDRWLAEAIANVPNVLAAYQVGLPRPLTAAGILRRLDIGSLGAPSSADGPRLWMSSLRRERGGVRLTSTESGAAGGDGAAWDPMARGAQAQALDQLRAQQMAREVLAPLTPRVMEGLSPGPGGG